MHLLMSFRFITTAVARPFAPIASRTFVTMASPVDPAKHAGQQFLNFVHNAPSPFHAVEESRIRLTAAGFTELKEKDSWDVKQGGRYFFTRNSATIIAFAVGGKYVPGNGFTIVGAHTDSPCLRVKPVSELKKGNFLSVGVELYGGGLWHTWFDRDLGLAGRVIVKDDAGAYSHRLVRIDRPILRIPTLAIHLNREVNTDGFKFNMETQLVPVLATAVKGQLERIVPAAATPANALPTGPRPTADKHHPALIRLLADELKLTDPAKQLLDFELCVADTQVPVLGGIAEEFVFAPRIDNLMSSFCALTALLETSNAESLANEPNVRIIALYDHEEVGSSSAQGAASSLTEFLLRRLSSGGIPNAFETAIPKSMLISADMAHAQHPNYSEKHEENHRPAFHCGPVMKFNANQRYATNAVVAAILHEVATKNNIPMQDFVVRNDSACGSTIGPILAANLAMRTIDIGSPQLSMHSIREMCATTDIVHCTSLLKAFFEQFPVIDAAITVD